MKWSIRGANTSLLGYSLLIAFLLVHTSEAAAQTAGTFMPVGSMNTPRLLHISTLLADGRVLIAGGDSICCRGLTTEVTEASAELCDPSTRTFTATGSMTTPRWGHTATLLPNGKVLIVGGTDSRDAELYDPSTGIFTVTGSMNGLSARTATSLPNGNVLIALNIPGAPPCHFATP
jgi:hypothetical protein